ncbi:MAG: sulfite exporter TauE/SafE family protein [Chakrabartia sp.]
MGLAVAFFVTALLYASVGFGGGSTYSALLALSNVDFRVLPAIALLCNIVVVTGGTIRYSRAGLVPWRRVLPLACVSAPFAWLGGLTPIKETTFLLILALSLIVAGLALLFQKETQELPIEPTRTRKDRGFDILTGVSIGYFAGLVGIGGGIFLAPYLHLTRWAGSRAIAATASVFILINSISGLAGQMMKLTATGNLPVLTSYWPLAFAVLVGGQIGSVIGVQLLSPLFVRRATAFLIMFVAGQLFWKLLG